jgi:hypothetical protein
VRATLVLLLLFGLCTGEAHAQAALDVGAPEAAFAGGPIHLSKLQATLLRSQYQGDKVPLIPQPFRGKLDTALMGHAWQRVDAVKKDLVAAHGVAAALAWEQSRFVATGAIGVAELHALDIAATGASAISETAVMMWFYAVAVTMTDGHKCVDEAAKDAHLDKLRGPAFEPVTKIVRSISDDRLAAMRDLAIHLETVLAPVRTDDTMCRNGGAVEIKPDAAWRPEAVATRAMLPRHLVALASVMRPRPIARPEPPKPEPVKPVAAKPPVAPTVAPPEPAKAEPIRIEPALPDPVLALPLPAGTVKLDPVTVAPAPAVPAAAPVSAEAAKTATPAPVQPPSETGTAVVNRKIEKPNPSRFEPPSLELTVPGAQGGH